jgi:hypothetical protein
MWGIKKNRRFRFAIPYFIMLFILSLAASGQYNTNFLLYNKLGRSVSANLDFETGSNGFTNELLNKLIWGGHISNDLKARASKNMHNRSNFGIALNYDVTAFVKGGKRFDFLIGVKNQEVLNAAFTRDFFNLAFYGNQMFRGREARLGNCSVNALRFQEIKMGLIMHHVDTSGRIGLSVSFLKGEQLFFIRTFGKSNLFTSADGSEIVLNSNFSMALSDTGNKKLGSFNGIGASADVFFETPYKSKKGRRCMLTVNANNIGFIYWRNNSVQYSSDSVLKFSGYEVRNIYDLKDSTLKKINRDSILRDLSNARHEPFNVFIPTNLVLINRIFYNNGKFALATGFRYVFNANYVPNVFVEPEYYYKNLILVFHAGYGGYARINLGASATYNGKKFFVRLGSNSLQGFILPQYSYGMGIFFSTAYKFK